VKNGPDNRKDFHRFQELMEESELETVVRAAHWSLTGKQMGVVLGSFTAGAPVTVFRSVLFVASGANG
jgi:hypothetical protein